MIKIAIIVLLVYFIVGKSKKAKRKLKRSLKRNAKKLIRLTIALVSGI